MDFTDLFESNLIVENETGQVANHAILGKVRGQFFVPNGTSRNNRYYPRSLWEKQLLNPDLVSKLRDRRMFGTISHEQPLNDQALLEGKVSHIVTNLYIDEEGRGMGEAVILNTAAGQILNTVLRAGAKLFVSSRATGKFQGEHKGTPMVDENHYSLTTFDYVMDPGFLEANPNIAESLDKIFIEQQIQETQGDDDMVNEKLIRENQDLKTAVDALAEAKTASEKQLETAVAEKAALTEQLAKQDAVAAEFKTAAESAQTQANEAKTKLESLEKVNEELSAVVASFAPVGTAEEFAQVVEASRALQAELKEFQEMGTLEEISVLHDYVDSIAADKATQKRTDEIAAIAKEMNVDVSVVEKIHGKMEVSEIKEFLKGLTNVGEWRQPAPANNVPPKEPKVVKGTAENIMEGLYKRSK